MKILLTAAVLVAMFAVPTADAIFVQNLVVDIDGDIRDIPITRQSEPVLVKIPADAKQIILIVDLRAKEVGQDIFITSSLNDFDAEPAVGAEMLRKMSSSAYFTLERPDAILQVSGTVPDSGQFSILQVNSNTSTNALAVIGLQEEKKEAPDLGFIQEFQEAINSSTLPVDRMRYYKMVVIQSQTMDHTDAAKAISAASTQLFEEEDRFNRISVELEDAKQIAQKPLPERVKEDVDRILTSAEQLLQHGSYSQVEIYLTQVDEIIDEHDQYEEIKARLQEADDTKLSGDKMEQFQESLTCAWEHLELGNTERAVQCMEEATSIQPESFLESNMAWITAAFIIPVGIVTAILFRRRAAQEQWRPAGPP